MVDWHGLLGGEGEVNEWVVLVFGRVRPAREAPRLSFKIPFAISTSDERERRSTHTHLQVTPIGIRTIPPLGGAVVVRSPESVGQRRAPGKHNYLF